MKIIFLLSDHHVAQNNVSQLMIKLVVRYLKYMFFSDMILVHNHWLLEMLTESVC